MGPGKPIVPKSQILQPGEQLHLGWDSGSRNFVLLQIDGIGS